MQPASPAIPAAPSGRAPLRVAHLGDEILARMTAAGRMSAFAVLYERYHQPLYRYCRSIVRDEADAQDALQSTFAGALSALQRGGPRAPLRPWLFRIAHNESISVLRRRRAREVEPEVEPEGHSASAEERAGERERFQTLVADLAELPDRPRSALVMRELSGLSHEEIAVALGTSVGAAKQAIFEARRGLAELEEGRAMNCEDVQRKISDGDGRALRGRRVRAHMRGCGACAAFASAIPSRRADLRALAPPLVPAASAALFSQIAGTAGTGSAGGAAGGLGAGGATGGLGAGAAGGIGAPAATVGKTVTATVLSKAVAGAAAVVTAAAGVGGVATVLHLDRHGARVHREPLAAPDRRGISARHSHAGAVTAVGRNSAGRMGRSGRSAGVHGAAAARTAGRAGPGAAAHSPATGASGASGASVASRGLGWGRGSNGGANGRSGAAGAPASRANPTAGVPPGQLSSHAGWAHTVTTGSSRARARVRAGWSATGGPPGRSVAHGPRRGAKGTASVRSAGARGHSVAARPSHGLAPAVRALRRRRRAAAGTTPSGNPGASHPNNGSKK